MINGLTINYLRYGYDTTRFEIRYRLRLRLRCDVQFTIHDITVRYLIDLDSKPNLPKTQEQYTNTISVSVSNNILSTFKQ